MNLKTHLWPKWSLLMEINWQMPIISLTYALLHVCIKFDWLGLRNKRQIWKSSFLSYFANVQFSDLLSEHVHWVWSRNVCQGKPSNVLKHPKVLELVLRAIKRNRLTWNVKNSKILTKTRKMIKSSNFFNSNHAKPQ